MKLRSTRSWDGVTASSLLVQPRSLRRCTPLQAGVAHQSLHPSMADMPPLAQDQLRMDPAVPVGAIGGGMDLTDLGHEVGLREVLPAGRRGSSLVIARGRDTEYPADHRDGDPVRSELLDHREHYFGRPSPE